MSLVLTGTSSGGTIASSSTNVPVVLQDSSGNTNTCQAWVNFNGVTTITLRASFNVSSVTRISAGNYQVNFTNSLTDINYAPIISTGDGSQVTNIDVNYNSSGTLTAPTTSAFIFSTSLIGVSARDQTYINVVVFR